jgi:hypothetical protein
VSFEVRGSRFEVRGSRFEFRDEHLSRNSKLETRHSPYARLARREARPYYGRARCSARIPDRSRRAVATEVGHEPKPSRPLCLLPRRCCFARVRRRRQQPHASASAPAARRGSRGLGGHSSRSCRGARLGSTVSPGDRRQRQPDRRSGGHLRRKRRRRIADRRHPVNQRKWRRHRRRLDARHRSGRERAHRHRQWPPARRVSRAGGAGRPRDPGIQPSAEQRRCRGSTFACRVSGGPRPIRKYYDDRHAEYHPLPSRAIPAVQH